nr:receptor-like cytosolic serine/threonine-protein kinase RBK2 [Ipomoea batatas]
MNNEENESKSSESNGSQAVDMQKMNPNPRLSRRKCKSMREDLDMNLCPIKPSWKFFTLVELKTATAGDLKSLINACVDRRYRNGNFLPATAKLNGNFLTATAKFNGNFIDNPTFELSSTSSLLYTPYFLSPHGIKSQSMAWRSPAVNMVRQSAPPPEEAGNQTGAAHPVPNPIPAAAAAFNPTDRTNPLYLHPNESPALQLVTGTT